jgi:NADPH:quinone reductase-like Zn-dependent oxidoreductase
MGQGHISTCTPAWCSPATVVVELVVLPIQINPCSAYGLIDSAAVPQGEWLLQTAAGSVLGRVVTAMARLRGIRTISVVRRKEQKEELLQEGYDPFPSPEQALRMTFPRFIGSA